MLGDELGWQGGARLLWLLLRWVVPPLILAFVIAGHLVG
jgi:hypothetical protein